MVEEEKKMQAALDAAAKKLRDGGQKAENEYGRLYQSMVRAGYRSKLRKRYR